MWDVAGSIKRQYAEVAEERGEEECVCVPPIAVLSDRCSLRAATIAEEPRSVAR